MLGPLVLVMGLHVAFSPHCCRLIHHFLYVMRFLAELRLISGLPWTVSLRYVVGDDEFTFISRLRDVRTLLPYALLWFLASLLSPRRVCDYVSLAFLEDVIWVALDVVVEVCWW